MLKELLIAILSLFKHSELKDRDQYTINTNQLQEDGEDANGNKIVSFYLTINGEVKKVLFNVPISSKAYDSWKRKETDLKVYVWEENKEMKALPTNFYTNNALASLILVGIILVILIAFIWFLG